MRLSDRVENIVKSNKVMLENLTYMSLLHFFLLIYPLITYPYLVRVLGKELYGIVLTAQMLASYASLVVNFSSDLVCAKHISINRKDTEKLSVIVSNIFSIRSILFLLCFLVYIGIVLLVPIYRTNYLIFLLMYGLTTNELFFLQFVFQGLEKMKYISLISVLGRILMILFIFVFVKTQADVLLVPLIYTMGSLIGGIYSIYIIVSRMNIKFILPNLKSSLYYLKDCLPIFMTDVICSIKDRFSYLLIGFYVGMTDVVVYDLGLKLHVITSKPYTLINTIVYPRMAREKNLVLLKKIIFLCLAITLLVSIFANIFLKDIVFFFLHEHCDLLPLRLFLIGPIILSVSYTLSTNYFVAFGYNRYIFYSILITTISYFFCLLLALLMGMLNSILSFICIALIAYVVELVYRLYLTISLQKRREEIKI